MESFTFDGTELSQKSNDTLSRVDDVFCFVFANDVAESFLSVFVCDWDLPSDIDSGRPPSESCLSGCVSQHTEVVVKSSSTFEVSLSLLYLLTSALRCVCVSLCLRSLLFAGHNQISDAGASALAAALQGSQLKELFLCEYLNESL